MACQTANRPIVKNASAHLSINSLGHIQCHEHLKKHLVLFCVALGFFYSEAAIS